MPVSGREYRDNFVRSIEQKLPSSARSLYRQRLQFAFLS